MTSITSTIKGRHVTQGMSEASLISYVSEEKHDGTIKARGCTDGWSLREYTSKSETSSPTVSL